MEFLNGPYHEEGDGDLHDHPAVLANLLWPLVGFCGLSWAFVGFPVATFWDGLQRLQDLQIVEDIHLSEGRPCWWRHSIPQPPGHYVACLCFTQTNEPHWQKREAAVLPRAP